MSNEYPELRIMCQLRSAADECLIGYYKGDWASRRKEGVITELHVVAASLGFDLVKRQPPQEAHETMLAKRLAEDGQAEETVGFR